MSNSKEQDQGTIPELSIKYFFYHYVMLLLIEIVQAVVHPERQEQGSFEILIIKVKSLAILCLEKGQDHLPEKLRKAAKRSKIVVPRSNIISPN